MRVDRRSKTRSRSGRMRERETSKKAAARNRHGREWVIFSAFQWKMGGRGDQEQRQGLGRWRAFGAGLR